MVRFYQRRLLPLTELGCTLRDVFHTPKGSSFPRKECLLGNRVVSYSKGLVGIHPGCSQGVVGGKGQQIPTGPLSSGLHSAERVSVGIDYP